MSPFGTPWPAQPMGTLGWRCPGCGACYAPFMVVCTHCKPRTVPGVNTTTYPATVPGPEPDFPNRTPEQIAADQRARLDTLAGEEEPR